MRISPCYGIKNTFAPLAAAAAIFVAVPAGMSAQESGGSQDVFEKTSVEIPPQGSVNKYVLLTAPDSEIYIEGEKRNAKIIVDISKNVLYKYNDDGEAEAAYLVASGKKTAPTDIGVRVVSHVESYPYKNAPASTKRHRQPWNYGPRAIILEKLDPETGRRSQTGEFIHGNNNPDSLGKYASLGCIRMDNEVIKQLAREVKRGDIVIVKK